MIFWKTVILDGIIKMGLIAFFVPSTMLFVFDVYDCLKPSKEVYSHSSCDFYRMQGIFENLITYLAISFFGGLIAGLIFLERKSKRKLNLTNSTNAEKVDKNQNGG